MSKLSLVMRAEYIAADRADYGSDDKNLTEMMWKPKDYDAQRVQRSYDIWSSGHINVVQFFERQKMPTLRRMKHVQSVLS